MSSLPRWLLALRVLTVIFLIITLVALVWSPALPATETPVTGLDATLAARVSGRDGAAEAVTIVNGNVFSPARRPPAQRYRPFAPIPETTPVRDPAPADSPPAVSSGMPQFFGTVAGPRGTFALLRLEPGSEEAQMYREGEGAGGYRVEKINEQSVVLIGPKGRIVLRLTRPGEPTP